MTYDAGLLRSDPEGVLDPSFVPIRHPAAITESIDGESVLWGDEWTIPAHLDAPSSLLWTFLDGQVTLRDLIADVAEVFEMPRREARAVVVPLVALLVADGYVLPPVKYTIADRRAGTDGPAAADPLAAAAAADDVVYHRPLLPVNPALRGVLRPADAGTVALQLHRYRCAVIVDDDEVAATVRRRWADHTVEDPYVAPAFVVTTDRLLDGHRVSVLWTECGRPLALADDVTGILHHLDAHLGALIDVQTGDRPALRLVALERDHDVTLIQPEFLFSLPDLAPAAASLGYRLHDRLYVPVDPADLTIVGPALATPDPTHDRRHSPSVGRVVLVSGPGSLPPLASPGAWVWALALATCPGNLPRPGGPAERLALARRLVDDGVDRVSLEAFDLSALIDLLA